ncbi:MAG: hypothetical protein ACT4QA_21175, partial [Panacagrimonas sp.]
VSREASRIEGTPGTSIRGIAAQSAPLSRRYHSVRTDFILMHYHSALFIDLPGLMAHDPRRHAGAWQAVTGDSQDAEPSPARKGEKPWFTFC